MPTGIKNTQARLTSFKEEMSCSDNRIIDKLYYKHHQRHQSDIYWYLWTSCSTCPALYSPSLVKEVLNKNKPPSFLSLPSATFSVCLWSRRCSELLALPLYSFLSTKCLVSILPVFLERCGLTIFHLEEITLGRSTDYSTYHSKMSITV